MSVPGVKIQGVWAAVRAELPEGLKHKKKRGRFGLRAYHYIWLALIARGALDLVAFWLDKRRKSEGVHPDKYADR